MINILTDPFFIFSVVIILGYIIGKIKFWGFSLQLSSILLIAVFCGVILSIAKDDTIAIQTTMKNLSSFGTLLFISAIGLTSGRVLRTEFSKIQICGFIIASLMVISAILTMKLVENLNIESDYSMLTGILCGALTSTPGLVTLADSPFIVTSHATIGYGSAYIFGVFGIVLFVQIVCKFNKIEIAPKSMVSQSQSFIPQISDLIDLFVTIIIGKVIGYIAIPFFGFSLGSTGGILCSGLILSSIQKKNTNYSLFQNLGLIIFLASTGITAGIDFLNDLSIKNVLIGILFTIIPILSGYIICFCLKMNTLTTLGIIAGGMTSSPAFGILMNHEPENSVASVYSMSYLGALCTIVIGMRIL